MPGGKIISYLEFCLKMLSNLLNGFIGVGNWWWGGGWLCLTEMTFFALFWQKNLLSFVGGINLTCALIKTFKNTIQQFDVNIYETKNPNWNRIKIETLESGSVVQR